MPLRVVLPALSLGLGLVACPRAPDPAASPHAGGLTLVVEPDGSGVAEALLSALDRATSAVHVEMYLLTSPTYLAELEALSARGLDVEVLLNRDFPDGTLAAETNEDAFSTLSRAGVRVRWAPTTTGFSGFTHAKMVLIDPGEPLGAAWIMTMNLDATAMNDNREYLVEDTQPADVAEAEAIFEADDEGVWITPSGPLVVAPSPANDAVASLLALVGQAAASIDIEMEEVDDQGVEEAVFDAIASKAQAGVAVRLVIEAPDDDEERRALRALGDDGALVTAYADASGAGLHIHAKAIVVDGSEAYVGSENLSGGSLGDNREIGLVATDPAVVAEIAATIARDIEGGTPYVP